MITDQWSYCTQQRQREDWLAPLLRNQLEILLGTFYSSIELSQLIDALLPVSYRQRKKLLYKYHNDV